MSKQLYIFGAGIHARKVYHYAVSLGWKVVAFIDEAIDVVSPISTVPVLHPKNLGAPVSGRAIFIAIGSAEVRHRLMDRMQADGWILPSLVHASAWVSPDAVLGAGVLVCAGAVIETAVVIGRGAIIDIGVLLDHECQVEPFFHLRAAGVYGPHSSYANSA